MLRPSPSSTRAAATTPAEPVGARVARFPTAGSLPRISGGSASASLRFEACTAFNVVAARVVAEPPKAVLWRRSASADVVASIVRSDCYRLERQLPGGIRTRWGMAPCHGAPRSYAKAFRGARRVGTRPAVFPGQVDVLPAERRNVGQEFRPAAPQASAGRARRPGQRPRPARRFPSSGRGARCLRCFRQRPHRPAPRRPAGAGPSPRENRRSASQSCGLAGADGGSRQQRLSDVAVSGATAPARRRRRGTRGPQMEQHRRLPGGGDQGQTAGAGPEGLRILKPEDRDAGRAKRRISPPPANNPRPRAHIAPEADAEPH